MSFLHRRSGQQQDLKVEESTPRLSLNLSPGLGRPRSAKLIKRVSTIFSPRKKDAASGAISNIAVGSGLSRWDEICSPSTPSSPDDIRRPSGLGRSVSISSQRSLPPNEDEPPYPDGLRAPVPARIRTVSSPNVLRTKSWVSFLDKPLPIPVPSPPPSPSPSQSPIPSQDIISTLPPEVLEIIMSYIPRGNIAASLAVVSRAFRTASRVSLYRHLNLETIPPDRVGQMNALLASRRDLAELVLTFICRTWPSSFSLRRDNELISVLSSSTAMFTIALQNMHRLTDLTLPSFGLTLLRRHTAFGLRNLTFLQKTITAEEKTDLFAWLDGQTNIVSLSLPNLIEENDSGSHHTANLMTNPSTFLNTSPSPTPISMMFPTDLSPTVPAHPYSSPTLLPSLTTLHAPPDIVILLAPTRALTDITLHIHTTLYDGLRPSALMVPLRGVANLAFRFEENVDRRTVEKVLGAAGAMLGEAQDDGDSSSVEKLEVEIAWLSVGSDETIYRIIYSVLPRFRSLKTLIIRTRVYTDSNGDGDGATRPDLTTHDRAHVRLWLKQCSSLRSIQLLSGARWRAS